MRDLIAKLRSERTLVIGDVMLDRYWWGIVDRISPEAPVPVVALEKVTHVAGGAANVAANINGLGSDPILVGIVGNDPERDLLVAACREAGIDALHLFETERRKTTVKNRVVAHNQHMLRFDQETPEPLDEHECRTIVDTVSKLISDCKLVVISDYAKGLLTPDLTKQVIGAARTKQVPVIVDPKASDYGKYRGATVITPNQKEAEEACSLALSDQTVDSAGDRLLWDLDLQGVVITRGERGMRVYERGRPTADLPASARMVYNVTGAGDTVIAALATGLASGLSLIDAAMLANFAAGIVVEDVGTTIITLSMLQEALSRHFTA